MYFKIEIDLQQMHSKVSNSIKEYQKVSKSIKKYQKVSKSIKKYQKVSSNVVEVKTFKQILIVSTLWRQTCQYQILYCRDKYYYVSTMLR